ETKQKADETAQQIDDAIVGYPSLEGYLSELQNNTIIAVDNAHAALDKAEEAQSSVVDLNVNIDRIQGQLDLNASREDINKITGRVETAETLINANTEQIGLRAFQSDVDTINDTVSTLSADLSIEAGRVDIAVGKIEDNESAIANLRVDTEGIQSS